VGHGSNRKKVVDQAILGVENTTLFPMRGVLQEFGGEKTSVSDCRWCLWAFKHGQHLFFVRRKAVWLFGKRPVSHTDLHGKVGAGINGNIL
jgi:hypothetical protein